MSIAALVLAAGESTRMGRLKQLIEWEGVPLIAWQCEQLHGAGVDRVVVVLGHAAEEIRPAVPAFATVVVNEAYQQGRARSLDRGAEALAVDTDAILILSVDQPRPAWLTRRLIARWRIDRPAVVSPRFGGGYGHPILLDGSLLPELREVREETMGLRAVIDRHLDAAVSIEIAVRAVDTDLNTLTDYEAAVRSYEAGKWADDKA